MPPVATKSKSGKISKSHILTCPTPKGHVMSGRCEQPLDELTVQVWLLYNRPNFKYCTLSVSGMELWTDKMDKQMDNQITRCHRRTFQAGGIKTICPDYSIRGHNNKSTIYSTLNSHPKKSKINLELINTVCVFILGGFIFLQNKRWIKCANSWIR